MIRGITLVAAALAMAAWGCTTQPAWRIQNARRQVETRRIIAALPESAQRSLALADRATRVADSLAAHDRVAAAIDTIRAQVETRRRWLGPRHPDVAASLSHLARLEFSQGALSAARAHDELALAIRRETLGARHPDVAESLAQLGRDLKTAGAPRGEVLALYQQALELRRQLFRDDSPEVAESLMDRGNLYRSMSRRDDALRDFSRALAIRRHGDPASEEVASTLNAMVLTHTAAGDWSRAEPLARESARIRRALGPDAREGLVLTLGTYGMVLRHLGRLAEAESLLVETAALQETRRHAATPGAGRVSMFSLSVYWELAATQIERGHDAAAWLSTERALSRTLVEAAIARGEIPAADPWQGLLARVQRAMPDSAALVGWLDIRRGAGDSEYPFWCYCIRRTGPPIWRRGDANPGSTPTSFELDIRNLRSALRAAAAWPLRVSDTTEVTRLAQRVYGLRVAPLEPSLAGVRELIVVSPDVMYGAPLEALWDDTGKSLADRFTIVYAPSALLYALTHERSTRSAAPAEWLGLLVADPERALPGIGGRLPPRLSGASTEARHLAAMLSRSTLLVGAGASHARLQALAATGRLDRFDLVHFATHAEIDEVWPGRSALLLASGEGPDPGPDRLTADEIAATWKLDARLVSLAACRTLLGGPSRTEGYVGIGQSFLAAGAHNLLVSLWPVDDRATSMLLVRFYEELLGRHGPPAPPALALGRARRWVRNWRDADGNRPYRHPSYWTGVVLMGGES